MSEFLFCSKCDCFHVGVNHLLEGEVLAHPAMKFRNFLYFKKRDALDRWVNKVKSFDKETRDNYLNTFKQDHSDE